MAHAPDRRRVLHAAAAAAAALWLPGCATSPPAFAANPFQLGVASGSPQAGSVVLWTRLMGPAWTPLDTPETLRVRWEVAHDEGFTRIARAGEASAPAALAHSVHAEVDGLEPDRWYWYRFLAGDAVSPPGRTRTLPAAGAPVQRLRLAYASCQRWDHGYFDAYRHMRREDVDGVLFLGDYIYESAGGPGAVRMPPGGWVMTLDDYRRRYALHRSEAALRDMHAACPWFVTWDDHEVQNDYAGRHPGKGGPPVADFMARRAAAYQAFYEHMPLRPAVLPRALAGLAAGDELRIYGEYRFGALATMVLLDDRQYRDAQACTPRGGPGGGRIDPRSCAALADPARTLLGAEQERWLDDALARAKGRWTIVAQQTLFGRRDSKPGPGETLWNDGWDGYPAARRRLTESMQRRGAANPVLIGGDVHENWVGHVKADYLRPDSETLGVEFCGTSITSRSGGMKQLPRVLAENPHFVFADTQRHGYGVCEFTPGRLTTTLRVVDDVARPDQKIETLASFRVAAGQPRLERL